MENVNLNIVSDLHLDIDGVLPELPGGEVLVIAGDLCEARSLTIHEHLTKDELRIRTAIREFIDNVSNRYEKIFMVMGNHEHYHNKFNKTWQTLVDNTPSNFHILDNDCVKHNGVLFVGATLWTDLNKNDPLTQHTVRDFMNDYKCITYVQGNEYRKLRPGDTVREHFKSLNYIKGVLDNTRNTDKKVVVITHHAPSSMSIAEQYRNDQLMNGAYYSDLSDLILDNPQIPLWIHGHTHTAFDYMIGDTRVICNPFGYQVNGHREYTGFDASLTVSV